MQGLVGQRYGHVALPASVPADDFELIRSTLRKHRNRETRDAPLLDMWYRRDTNNIPQVYRLLNPTDLVDSPECFTLVSGQDNYMI